LITHPVLNLNVTEQRDEYKNNTTWSNKQKAEFKTNEMRKFIAILFL